jgi:hypothetical protein
VKKQRTCEEAEEILSKFLLANGMNIKYHPNNKALFDSQPNIKYSDKYCYHYCVECGDPKKSKYKYLRDKQCLKCAKCGSKSGAKVTSIPYQDLLNQCIESFNKIGINLLIDENNKSYFESQSSNPNNRKCQHKCPSCNDDTKTQYSFLKKGIFWCKRCKSKKISKKLSYSYEEIMSKVLHESKARGIDLAILDNNLEKFNSQTKMTTRKLCYHRCPCCGCEKTTTYSSISRGKSYFCKMCVGSINENIFSIIINNLFNKIKNNSKLENLNIFDKNNKKNIEVNGKSLFPDFFATYQGKSIIIEYQGRQHYEAVDKWGGEDKLKRQQERDTILRDYCSSNNINLIEIDGRRVSYNNAESFVSFFKTENFTTFISKFFSLELEKFMIGYSFDENLNVYIQRNYELYKKIIILYFENQMSEKQVAGKLNLKKRYVNKIINLYLNKAFNLKLGKLYSREDHKKNINRNRQAALPRGSSNKSSKLNDCKVTDILQRIKKGESDSEISQLYNVSSQLISLIRNNKFWKHIDRS